MKMSKESYVAPWDSADPSKCQKRQVKMSKETYEDVKRDI